MTAAGSSVNSSSGSGSDSGNPRVSIAHLRAALLEQAPVLAPVLTAPTTALTLNCEYVEEEGTAWVGPADEVAVVPAVSGG